MSDMYDRLLTPVDSPEFQSAMQELAELSELLDNQDEEEDE
jgi:hypothetical protein